MKHYTNLFAFILILSLTFVSCKDEAQAPVITNFEVGYDDSKTSVIGEDLHLEAEIVAEAKISKILLTIHPEGEAEHAPAQKATSLLTTAIEWEVDTVYTTKFEGLKNSTFHEHIEIPVTAAAGGYHLHFTVVDMDGNAKELESELTLVSAQ